MRWSHFSIVTAASKGYLRLCFVAMNVMTSKKDPLSSFHGFLITVGQKLGFAAGAGSTYNPGMCKQEAPSNIHWPLDPTGSCQHGWDDWGHFFYPVDLPGEGTGKNERRRALTSYSKSDHQTAFSHCWCPCKLKIQKAEQTDEGTLGEQSRDSTLAPLWYEPDVKLWASHTCCYSYISYLIKIDIPCIS